MRKFRNQFGPLGCIGIILVWVAVVIFIGVSAVENDFNSVFGYFIPGWVAFLVGLFAGPIVIPISVILWALHFTPMHFPLVH